MVVANFIRDLTTMERYASEAMVVAEKIGHSDLAGGSQKQLGNLYAGPRDGSQTPRGIGRASYRWPGPQDIGKRLRMACGCMGSAFLEKRVSHRGNYAVRGGSSHYRSAGWVQSAFGVFLPGTHTGNLGKISDALSALQESLDFAKRNDHGVALTRASEWDRLAPARDR